LINKKNNRDLIENTQIYYLISKHVIRI